MQHRLAAVLMADVVGYARLMGADEAGALAAWRERLALRDILPIRRQEDFDQWADGMRKAGLPE
jgi:class 3 adenylate cyclase